MQITVNGTGRSVQDNTPLTTLLEQLCLKPQATVVERNGAIVDQARFQEIVLAEGDVLELIRFVGGG